MQSARKMVDRPRCPIAGGRGEYVRVGAIRTLPFAATGAISRASGPLFPQLDLNIPVFSIA